MSTSSSSSSRELYTPLDKSQAEIRLIRLQPTIIENTIFVTMEKVSLHNLKVKYYALSYTWGSPTDTVEIIVNGFPFRATSNLASFFRNLQENARLNKEIIYGNLWVDAICINQNDIDEKNYQVPLMKSIYENADLALAWLGPAADMSSAIIPFFHIFGKEIKQYGGTGKPDSINELSWDIYEGEILTSPDRAMWVDKFENCLCKFDEDVEFGNRIWYSISKVFERPYWRRAWTFQEMVIPKQMLVLCGREVCRLDYVLLIAPWLERLPGAKCPNSMDPRLWNMLSTSEMVHHFMHTKYVTKIFKGRLLLGMHTLGSGFRPEFMPLLESVSVTLIAATAFELHATDPRDKIYGLLALAPLPITPDYRKPVDAIFYELAKLGVQRGCINEMLCSAGYGLGKPTEKTWDLPSWVPDWMHLWRGDSKRMQRLEIEKDWFDPWGNGVLDLDIKAPEVEGRTLKAYGIALEEIRTVSPRSNMGELYGTFSKFMNDFKDSRYPTGIPYLQAFFRVFFLDKDLRTLHNMVRLNMKSRSFLYQACAFISIFATLNKDIPWQETLLSFGFQNIENFGSEYQTWLLGHDWGGDDILEGKTFLEVSELGVGCVSSAQVHFSRSENWSLFTTKAGYIGLGPVGMQPTDIVCILYSCNAPVVLRKDGDDYFHIGCCFILGFMDGEVVEEVKIGKRTIQEFRIL